MKDDDFSRRSRVRRDPRPTVDRLFLGLLIFSPIALGGTNPWAQAGLAVAAILIASLGLFLETRAVGSRALRVPLLAPLLIGLGLWTLFRSTGLSGIFAPDVVRSVYELWPQVAPRANIAPGYASLNALRFAALALVCAYAATRFSTSAARQKLFFAALAAGTLVLAISAAQWLLGATEILFVYSPRHRDEIVPLAGPFVNPNQAGSWLGLLSILLLASAVAIRDRSARFGLVLFSLIPFGVVLLLSARGAAGSVLVATLLLLITVPMRAARSERIRRTLPTICAGLLLLLTAIFVYLILPGLDLDLPSTWQRTLEKSVIWNDSLRLIASAPLVGFGPMSFADLYPAVASAPTTSRHSFVEALPLQLMIDHGVILFALLFAAVALPIARIGHPNDRTHSGDRLAMLAVALYLGCEAITGLGHQGMAWAITALALIGSAIAMPRLGRSKSDTPPAETDEATAARKATRQTIALIIAALALAALCAPSLNDTISLIRSDREVPLSAQLRQSPPDLQGALQEAERLAHLKPAEPDLLAQTALVETALGQTESARARILWLVAHAPAHPFTWRAAEVLALRSDDADLACRALSRLRERSNPARTMALLQLQGEDTRAWAACLPDEDHRAPVFNALLQRDRALDVIALAEEILATEDSGAALRAAATAWQSLDSPDGAALYATRLARGDDRSIDELLTAAQIHDQADDPARAERTWQRVRDHDDYGIAACLAFSEREAQRHGPAAALELIRACPTPLDRRDLVTRYARESELHEALGNLSEAVLALERALAVGGGRSLENRLRTLRARMQRERALRDDPDAPLPSILDALPPR